MHAIDAKLIKDYGKNRITTVRKTKRNQNYLIVCIITAIWIVVVKVHGYAVDGQYSVTIIVFRRKWQNIVLKEQTLYRRLSTEQTIFCCFRYAEKTIDLSI